MESGSFLINSSDKPRKEYIWGDLWKHPERSFLWRKNVLKLYKNAKILLFMLREKYCRKENESK